MIRSVYKNTMQSFIEYFLFEKKDIKPDTGSKIKSISKAKAKEIGDEINIDWKKCDLEEFRMGLEVEQEHEHEHDTNSMTPIAKRQTLLPI